VKKLYPSKCPLCAADAEYYIVDHEKKSDYKCTNCNRFLICISAEEYLKNLSEKELKGLSKKSKNCSNQELLEIKTKTENGDHSLFVEVSLRNKFDW